MLNIFTVIGHFFASLFGSKGSVVQKVIHGVSSFVNLALPIVEEIDNDLKAVIVAAPVVGPSVVGTIEKFLQKHLPDLTEISQIANGLVGQDSADALRTIAVSVLQLLVPAGTSLSLLNLAIELAYNTFKELQASKPAAATPAA